MANKFLSGINVTGTATLNTVANAGTDTDKFLVLDASGNIDFRTGDELYADLGIGELPSGYTSTVKHSVKAGVALTKGQAVYVTSADGINMIVGKASNASEATSSKTMGLIESSLSINGQGVVITEGLLAGLDTTGANAAGDAVWLGTDGNLIYGLTNKPVAPAHLVFIGIVTRRNANNGEIFVKVQNGFEMGELHNYAESGVANNSVIAYESSTSLYKPKSIATILGYTPANAATYVPYTGATTDVDLGIYSLTTSNTLNANSVWTNQLAGGSISGGAATLNLLGSDIIFATGTAGSSSWTEKMRLKVDGKLGIGTSAPSTQLETTNASASDVIPTSGLGGSTTTAFLTQGSTQKYGLVIGTLYTSGTVWLQSRYRDTTGSLPLSLQPNGGNVGIGTSSPIDKLTVSGRINVLGTNQNSIWLNQSAGGTSTGFLIGRSYTSADTQDFFIYDVAAGVRRLEISSTGAAIFSGSVTGGSFVKSGGTSAQILMADGSVLTAGSGITISGGTISSSGGGGSYVPLAGGTMTGALQINTNTSGLILNRGAVTNYTGVSYQTAGAGQWFVGMRENLSSNNYIIYNESGTDAVTISKSNNAVTLAGSITTVNGNIYMTNTNYAFGTNNWAGAGGYPGYSFTGGNSRFGFSSTSGYIDVYTDGNFYAGIDLNGSNNLVLHTGNYNSYAPTLTGGGASGTWGISITGSAGGVAWSNVSSKPSHIMYYQGFTLDANTMDANSTGFTYSVNAPYTGPIARFSAGGSYDLEINASYSGGTSIAYRTRNGDVGSWNSWYGLISTANIGSQSVSYASSAGSAPASGGTSTAAAYLNAGGYIYRGGFTGDCNSEFTNTPASAYRYNGDEGGQANGPGGTWWFVENFRHSNSTNYWGTQVAWGWEDNANRLATRNVSGGTFGGWVYYMNTNSYPYAAAMNQYVGTGSGPTFNNVYNNGWFRNNNAHEGLYSQYHVNHWYATSATDWNIGSTGNTAAIIFRTGSHQGPIRGYVYANNSNEIGFLNSGGGWSLRCDNSGNVTATGDITAFSDARVKENVKTIDNALDKVLALRGVSYTRIDSDNKKSKIGVIAQETLPIVPEVVNQDMDGMYSVAYGNLGGLFIEAFKEQQSKIDAQDKVIEELKKLIYANTK